MNNYEEELKALKEAEKQQAKTAIESRKQQALANVRQEESTMLPKFETQKQQAAVQSQIQAKNFAEYLSRRGQTSAGIAPTAELSRQNVLARDLGSIQQAQQQAQQQFATQRTGIEQQFGSELAGQLGTIESQYGKAALEYRERLRQEELARQEAEKAYQRQLELARTKSYGGLTTPFGDTGTVESTPKQPVQTQQDTYADIYVQSLIDSALKTNIKYDPIKINNQLKELQISGKITPEESRAIIVELYNGRLIK